MHGPLYTSEFMHTATAEKIFKHIQWAEKKILVHEKVKKYIRTFTSHLRLAQKSNGSTPESLLQGRLSLPS